MSTGTKDKCNPLKGYSGALLASTEELSQISADVQEGGMVLNRNTSELLVKTPEGIHDHMHPYTYSPLSHQHIFGLNESWDVGNPRLWYTDDLVNHPELCPLDGKEIPLEAADKLSLVYPGTKLLTEPLKQMTAEGYTNGKIVLTASSHKGNFLPSHLCGEVIDISNFANISDQWLVPNTSLDTVASFTIKIEGDYDYRPDSYWIIPAAGTATEILAKRPTPKSWTFFGSEDGSTWEVIDQVTDADPMYPNTISQFKCETLNAYKYFKLEITSWYPGEGELEVGLRRFWLFGRRPDTFCLPNIPSPHPDFSWVVPYRELNTSLKNEDVGDIGTTSILPSLLPSYRMETDGRVLLRDDYPELFAAIGWRYDDRELENYLVTITDDGFLVTFDSDVVLGNYSFTNYHEPDPIQKQIPLNWKVYGVHDDGTEDLLVTVTDNLDILAQYDMDTNIEEKAYPSFRFEVTEWAGTGSKTEEIAVGTHYLGEFCIPDIKNENATTYIVTRQTAHDVSSDIIQRLQADMIKLAQSHVSLQQQLQALMPDVEKD